MQKLYEYKKKLPLAPHWRGQEETLIIDGDRTFIELHIGRDEFRDLFGGYLLTQDSDKAMANCEYKGVWGKAKVRKFKQLMRQSGAEFEICKIDGSQRWIKSASQEAVP